MNSNESFCSNMRWLPNSLKEDSPVMRKFWKLQSLYRLSALAAVFALAILLAPKALAQGKQDFTVHNLTGVEIHALYVSPHSSKNWEEDVLGQDTLPDGESILITFFPKTKPKLWDLRIEDQDGNYIEWDSLNLLEISDVTLHYNAKTGRAWADLG
jgi:hypothetical protein